MKKAPRASLSSCRVRCVCVCERERERKREKNRERARERANGQEREREREVRGFGGAFSPPHTTNAERGEFNLTRLEGLSPEIESYDDAESSPRESVFL